MLIRQTFVALAQASTHQGLALNATVTAPVGLWGALSLTGPIGASATGTGAIWISNPAGGRLLCKWWQSSLGSASPTMPADFVVPPSGSHAVTVPFGAGNSAIDTILFRGDGVIAQAGVIFGYVTASVDLGLVDVPVGAVGT